MRFGHWSVMISTVLLALPALVRAESGISDDKIVIGTSQTGPDNFYSRNSGEFLDGSRALFNRINASGGINGRKIDLIALEDQYDAKKALENIVKLIEKDKVFAVYGIFGSKNFSAVMPKLERERVPLIGPTNGTERLNELKAGVFSFRAGVGDEVDALLVHLLDTQNVKSVAMIAHDDALGAAGVMALRKFLSARNMKPAAAEIYGKTAGKMPLGQALENVIKAKPEALLIWTNDAELPPVISALEKAQYKGVLAGPSNQLNQGFISKATRYQEGMIFASGLPLANDTSYLLIRNYQKDIKTLGKEVGGQFGVLGYFSARMFVEGAKLAGKNLTRDSLIKAYENMNNVDVEGISVSMSSSNHQAIRQAFLVKFVKGKFEPLK